MNLLNLQADLTKYRNCTNKSSYFFIFFKYFYEKALKKLYLLPAINVLIPKFSVEEYFEYLRGIIT